MIDLTAGNRCKTIGNPYPRVWHKANWQACQKRWRSWRQRIKRKVMVEKNADESRPPSSPLSRPHTPPTRSWFPRRRGGSRVRLFGLEGLIVNPGNSNARSHPHLQPKKGCSGAPAGHPADSMPWPRIEGASSGAEAFPSARCRNSRSPPSVPDLC